MNWMNFTAIAIAALFVGLQLFGWLQAKKSVGQPAPDTSAIDGEATVDDRRVYYFHSRHCGPCRSIAPLVAKISKEHRNLISVDIEINLPIAKAFSIAGTPSFVLVEAGRIQQVVLGGQSESRLLELLQGR